MKSSIIIALVALLFVPNVAYMQITTTSRVNLERKPELRQTRPATGNVCTRIENSRDDITTKVHSRRDAFKANRADRDEALNTRKVKEPMY